MPLPTTDTVTRPKALGYGARLNERWYRLAVGPDRELRIETAPLQAPTVSTAENPEDLRDEFGQLFSRVDFTGGEGLDLAHRRDAEPVDSTRYWDSRGIAIRDDDNSKIARVGLHRTTENIEGSTDANLHLAHDGTALYMTEGSIVRRSANPNAVPPAFASEDPHAGQPAVQVQDIVAVGDTVYAALGSSGIHKRASGAWSELSTFAAVKVWQAKDSLYASGGTQLVEVNLTTGATTLLVTLPTGHSWTCVADAGAAVLACATNGYVYALADDDAGVLELKAQTYVGPDVPQVVAAGHGQVFYATRKSTGVGATGKWWRAELSSTAYVLTDSVLLREWGHSGGADDDAGDHAPRAMVASRNGVYVGIAEDAGAFLWRYDQPTTARSRDVDAKAAGVVVDIIDIGDQLFFTVAGHGLRRESRTAYETEGYLIGPLADLFTASEKAWVGAILDHDPVPAGTHVELAYTTEPSALSDPQSTQWTVVKDVHGGSDASETPIPSASGRYLAGRIRMFGTGSVTPTVRGFTFRAYPGSAERIVHLPVNVSDTIEVPGRRRLRTKGLGRRVYGSLTGLEGSYAELELVDPVQVYRGIVEQVAQPVTVLPRRGSATAVSFVRFRGRPVEFGTGLSEDADDPRLGVGILGLGVLGGAAA